MARKDNFNQAMYEMFGIGKGGNQNAHQPDIPQETAAPPPPPPVEMATDGSAARDLDSLPSNVIDLPQKDGPELKIVTAPPTYIAPGTRIEGILRAEGSVEIDGEFRGDILAEGDVTVRTDITGNINARNLSLISCCLTGDAKLTEQATLNEGSAVNGNISAKNMISSGAVVGDLTIQKNMTLDEKAKVVGNISTGTMIVARGAIVRGNVETRGED